MPGYLGLFRFYLLQDEAVGSFCPILLSDIGFTFRIPKAALPVILSDQAQFGPDLSGRLAHESDAHTDCLWRNHRWSLMGA